MGGSFITQNGFLRCCLRWNTRCACGVSTLVGLCQSFYGVVDLLSVLPTYLSLWLPGAQFFLAVRILRVLRVFRVLRMVRYVGGAELIAQALAASRRKITVFVASVLALMVIFGSLMYVVEGGNPAFASIPHGIYWAGDHNDHAWVASRRHHADRRRLEQSLASFIMIYGIRHCRRTNGDCDARAE